MFGSCILYSSRDWTAPCFENWLLVKFSLNSLCMELLEVCQPLTVHSGQRPSMRDGMESPKVKRNPQNYFFSPLQQLFGAHFNCSLLNCESHCTGFWGSPTRPDGSNGFNATPLKLMTVRASPAISNNSSPLKLPNDCQRAGVGISNKTGRDGWLPVPLRESHVTATRFAQACLICSFKGHRHCRLKQLVSAIVGGGTLQLQRLL